MVAVLRDPARGQLPRCGRASAPGQRTRGGQHRAPAPMSEGAEGTPRKRVLRLPLWVPRLPEELERRRWRGVVAVDASRRRRVTARLSARWSDTRKVVLYVRGYAAAGHDNGTATACPMPYRSLCGSGHTREWFPRLHGLTHLPRVWWRSPAKAAPPGRAGRSAKVPRTGRMFVRTAAPHVSRLRGRCECHGGSDPHRGGQARASTATTAARRSSPGRCATPATR